MHQVRRSQGTGESRVERPFTYEQNKEEIDVDWFVDHFCCVMDVPVPTGGWKQTTATRNGIDRARGMYFSRDKRFTYTYPTVGVVIHELAHHVAYERLGNGHDAHGQVFGEILQEMIDLWV